MLGALRALLQRGAQADDWVLVHDAARCLVTSLQIETLIAECQHDSVGGLLAHKIPDTLKTAVTGPGGVRVVGARWSAAINSWHKRRRCFASSLCCTR